MEFPYVSQSFSDKNFANTDVSFAYIVNVCSEGVQKSRLATELSNVLDLGQLGEGHLTGESDEEEKN